MPEQSSNKDEFIDRSSRKDELQFVLEEYKSIRTESQARMGHRVTLLADSKVKCTPPAPIRD
jgi:hypothetical protein